MITLISYPPAFDEYSISAFCTKAAYLLNLSGEVWERQDTNDPRRWPKSKLPAIKVGDEIVGDSDNIRSWLEQRGADFDKGLSYLDKSTSRAFIRMAEEHLYFHLVLDRWADDRNWPLIRDTYFKDIPKWPRLLITRGLRKQLLRGMNTQGLGRLSAKERLARAEPDLKAISDRLWHGPFLFGDTVTAADVSVGPILASMAATPVATELSRRVDSDTILMDYAARVSDACATPSA